MSVFEEAIGPLLKNEGSGFVPADHGRGASKWGVTLATYREHQPDATDEDIKRLGPEEASAFYRNAFWEPMKVALLDSQEVANKVFDLGVNCGPVTAVKILQRGLGLPQDGVIGPQTAAAVNRRTPAAVLQAIRIAGSQYYQELVLRKPEWKNCLAGWLARLAK